MSFSAKQELIGQAAPASQPPAPVTVSTSAIAVEGEYEYYTVKSGDNLWRIAQQYPGISNEDLKRLNNITDTGNLKVGQRIRIRPKT